MAQKNLEKKDKLIDEGRSIRLENSGVDYEKKAQELEKDSH